MKQHSKSKIKVVVVLGPTSSGKSDAAIALAKKFNGEVISADSRQVYRDMNLGTGKVEGKWRSCPARNNPPQSPLAPRGEEEKKKLASRRREEKKKLASGGEEEKKKLAPRGRAHKVFVSEDVIHHLLDFGSPRGEYNVSHFQKDCDKLIEEISACGKLPIICGGTGFWIQAVTDGVILPQVKPNPALRKQLEKKTAKQLHAQLRKLDSARAKTIDKNNKVRLIRAIEICNALGSVPSPDYGLRITDYEFLQIGIDHKQEVLDKKIKRRLETRWTNGMIKEVENLRKKYRLSWKKIQSFGLGYFWIPEFLRGKIDKEELKEKVFRAERGYAKRQRTWFKRDKRIVWENDKRKIAQLVKNFLKK